MNQRKKPAGKIESRGSTNVNCARLLYYVYFFDTPKCLRNTSLQNYQRPFNWKSGTYIYFRKG